MYSVKKGVTISDFSEDTREFLKKVGFTETDDLSSKFEKIIKADFLFSQQIEETEENMFYFIFKFSFPKCKKVKHASVFSLNSAFSNFTEVDESAKNVIKDYPKNYPLNNSLCYQENKGCVQSC